jgi:hypothetical protein
MVYTEVHKKCAFTILPHGIAEKVGDGVRKGMLISKRGGKISISMLYSP